MKRYWVFLILIVLIFSGCKQRVVTQPEAQQQTQQKDQQKADASQTKATEKITEQKLASNVESVGTKDASSKAMEEKEGMFQDALFDYDKYDIKDVYKPVLKSLSSWLIKNPGARLSIEGHCDERGTNEYNLALGDRRSKAAKDYLISLGIPSARIDTISYGEEKPLCSEQTEECWAKNRRAHFVVLNKAEKK